MRQAVVYYEPVVARSRSAPPAEPFVMATRQKEFVPRMLAVPRGSRVRFPNEDPILHNVFSVSPDNGFDLGLYRKGPGKERTFDKPGLVRVFCNVHHGMVAYLLVLDTPFYASPDGRRQLRPHRPAPGPRQGSPSGTSRASPGPPTCGCPPPGR